MPRRAIARAVSAAMIGLGAVIPALVLSAPAATAAPALAASRLAAPLRAAPLLAANDCCQASIGGLPGKFVIGAGPSQFAVSFTNSGQQPISSLAVTFTFNGNGLDANRITMKRQAQNGSWQSMNVGRHNGSISATDNHFRFGQPIPPNGSTNLQYQLSFDSKAAPAQVQLGVTVNGRLAGRGFGQSTELAATGAGFGVVTAAPAPKPTSKPTPKPTPTQAASTPASTAPSAAAVDTGPGGPPITPADAASNSGTSSWVWLAYILGALLLLGGIAAIGTLLWRRGPDTSDTDWDDDGTALHPGGGVATYPTTTMYPTQPLPAQSYPAQPLPTQSYPAQPYPPQSTLPQSTLPPPQDPYGRHSTDGGGHRPS
jgi:hypothetical protein